MIIWEGWKTSMACYLKRKEKLNAKCTEKITKIRTIFTET